MYRRVVRKEAGDEKLAMGDSCCLEVQRLERSKQREEREEKRLRGVIRYTIAIGIFY